jgi:hypothetical protein
MMMDLHVHQAEECLEAGGAPAGWINAIQYNTGAKFKRLNGAPDSAVYGAKRELQHTTRNTDSRLESHTDASLGWQLTALGYSEAKPPRLPMAIHNAVQDTTDPMEKCVTKTFCHALPTHLTFSCPSLCRSEISHNDTKRVVAEVRKWLLSEFKKANYDKDGKLIVSAALRAAFPYIPNRNGRVISWFTKLSNAGNNMRNHPVRAVILTHFFTIITNTPF